MSIPPLQIDKLIIEGTIIGYGRDGTVVVEGNFCGRSVAVKRVLKVHADDDWKEILNHNLNGEHANIVRMYGYADDDDFIYIALERCICSLADLILENRADLILKPRAGVLENFNFTETNLPVSTPETWKVLTPEALEVLRGIIAGLAHLHKRNIMHRDVKPENVLIQEEDGIIIAKVADLGIIKSLPEGRSSVSNGTDCGSLGWQSPEQLRGEKRQSCGMDLFPLGCLLFFCITGGQHPFGKDSERNSNILADEKKLSSIADFPEAYDLIFCLLHKDPQSRLPAAEALSHHLFWEPAKRLSFLCATSDFTEGLKHTDKPMIELKKINNKTKTPPAFDWGKRIDKAFFTHMNNARIKKRLPKYDGKSIRHLLRIIRNANGHPTGLPEQFMDKLRPYPFSEGLEIYFRRKFPQLLTKVYKVMEVDCQNEVLLKSYYEVSRP